MVQRLNVKEDEDPEAVRRSFDRELLVPQWRTPYGGDIDRDDIEPGAPDWWVGEDDASASFLSSMGVNL